MDDFTLAEPAANPLDLSAFTQTSTPPFASASSPAQPAQAGQDKRQLLKLSLMLPLAMKAGPGAVQGLLQGFAQHDAQAKVEARQGQADQRVTQQQDWQRQYQQGELTNQQQQNQRALLNDFATKVGSLDDPAAIDALTKLYTAHASAIGLKPEALTAYAQTAANPTRLQAKAAQKKIAQWKTEYGTDHWMDQAGQFVHEMPGAPVDPTTGQPKRYTVDEVMALAGEQRDPNAPKIPLRPRPTPAVGSFEDYIGRLYGENPTPQQIETARRKWGDEGRVQPTAAASGPVEPLKRGTPDYQAAEDLASGKLTFQQFGRLYPSRAKNDNTKARIYMTARALNPDFNPADFEIGLSFAKNPQLAQRRVAIRSLYPVIDQIEALSSQVGNGDVQVFNRLLNGAKMQVSNQPVVNFQQLKTLLGDEVGLALGVGSASDLKTKLGIDLVNTNLSDGSFQKSMEQLRSILASREGNIKDLAGPYGDHGGGGRGAGANPFRR